MPVRSEPTQPVLPSISPIRLVPCEVKVPRASGPLVVAVFPATIVLPMVRVVPGSLAMPPPEEALLPVIVSSTAVSVPA